MPDTNNSINLIGKLKSIPEYDHSVYGEAFYKADMSIMRLSGAEDTVPVILSERLIDDMPAEEGLPFCIRGQIRSYNKRTETGSRLLVTVFAREFISVPPDEYDGDVNEAELTGFICKPVVYRRTPFSREIADMLLAVNRRYGKSDYLPCIAWGRNARFLQNVPVGKCMHILGRLQSRNYKKTLEDGEIQIRTAYEISCSAVEPVF